MRIRLSRQPAGSVLIITLVISGIIGMTLVAYLNLVDAQNLAVSRSMTWNAVIPACESGVEEALTHLNVVGAGDRATNGWSLVSGEYVLSRTIGESRYVVSISADSAPTVVATGFVKLPLKSTEVSRTIRVTTTRGSSGLKGLTAIGGIELVGNILLDSFDSEDPTYSTNGRYDSSKKKDNGFVGSVEGSITGGGGQVWGNAGTGPTGSADSAGTIGDASWHGGGNSGIQSGHYANDLNVSFPDVQAPFSGGAATPSYNQTVTTTNFTYTTDIVVTNSFPSGYAGAVSTNISSYTDTTYPTSPMGAVTTNTTAQHTTTYPSAGTYIGNVVTNVVAEGMGSMATSVTYYDYNKISSFTYDTVTYTYNSTTTNSTTTTEEYAMVLDSDNYELSSLSLSGQSKMLVRGDAVLYITGDMSMAGQSEIIIAPGASLKVYVAGNAQLQGNGVMNLNQDATKYSFFGLPTCTDIKLGGNAAFTGVIYAPQAFLHLGGGGSDAYDCVGAAVVGGAKVNGHFSFHYDERLGREGGAVQYRIASWNEI
ncbi:MAG: hypothetical protein AB1705_09250 [Verrucomicrobiota bacterium]